MKAFEKSLVQQMMKDIVIKIALRHDNCTSSVAEDNQKIFFILETAAEELEEAIALVACGPLLQSLGVIVQPANEYLPCSIPNTQESEQSI